MRIALALLFAGILSAATSVPTGHNNNSRTAANTTETVLSPTNVNSTDFGLLGTFASDGEIWGQPLIATNVGGINLLIFANQHNSIYAYNADAPNSAPVWKTNFGATVSITNPNLGNGELGCVGAPVIDEANSKVYVVCAGSGSDLSATYVLRQLSLTTGAVLQSVTITGQVTGTGDVGQTPPDTVSGGNVVFYPAFAMQRPALLLVNSKVYVGFGSYDDVRPWHGWIMSYNIADLTQANVFCASPNSFGGSFWQAGGGLSADASGHVFGITSNGNSATGVGDLSQRFMEFDSSLNVLNSLLDFNAVTNDAQDKDFGSGRLLLIPGANRAVSAGKDSRLYLTDLSMSHIQNFVLVNGGAAHFGGQTYINGALYIGLSGGPINKFAFDGSTLNTNATLSAATFAYPGAQLSSSSNGASNTIVWAVKRGALVGGINPATLLAYDGGTMALLYTSGSLGNTTKYIAPTVANGKVYVGTQDSGVAVLGLLAPKSSVISGRTTVSGKSVQ